MAAAEGPANSLRLEADEREVWRRLGSPCAHAPGGRQSVHTSSKLKPTLDLWQGVSCGKASPVMHDHTTDLKAAVDRKQLLDRCVLLGCPRGCTCIVSVQLIVLAIS